MRRIFLSYHHRDDLEAEVFCRRYEDLFDEIRRLGIPDEDEEQDLADHVDSEDADYVMRRIREKYIAGTSCTVVLIGKCTWARRYVDWEIAATLRNNDNDPRGGLIAVQLGSAAENGWVTLPPRLERNILRANGKDVGYARAYGPPPSDDTLASWVEEAIERRDTMEPVQGSTSDLRARSSPCD